MLYFPCFLEHLRDSTGPLGASYFILPEIVDPTRRQGPFSATISGRQRAREWGNAKPTTKLRLQPTREEGDKNDISPRKIKRGSPLFLLVDNCWHLATTTKERTGTAVKLKLKCRLRESTAVQKRVPL